MYIVTSFRPSPFVLALQVITTIFYPQEDLKFLSLHQLSCRYSTFARTLTLQETVGGKRLDLSSAGG